MNKSNILLYHGVTKEKNSVGIENCSGKHMDADVFEQQMKYISENKNVMTLRELVRLIEADEPCPPDCVAVTFDDSFKNIRTVALPILKKYNVPATFFITTAMVGNNRLFWVDRLEHTINRTDKKLLCLEGKYYTLRTSTDKIDTLTKVKRMLKSERPSKRNTVLKAIEDQLGVFPYHDVVNYENLTWDDVSELDDFPQYEVGGHTVNHEILSYLSTEQMTYEICHCLKILSERVGRDVNLFSYPEGQREHYNDEVISILKENGVRICPSAVEGENYDNDDSFHLKRNMVGFVGREFPFE